MKNSKIVDPEKFKPREMNNDLVNFHIKSVAGRVLTLIDGSIPQGAQNTALKSLIKKEFREQLSRAWEYAYDIGGSCAANQKEISLDD